MGARPTVQHRHDRAPIAHQVCVGAADRCRTNPGHRHPAAPSGLGVLAGEVGRLGCVRIAGVVTHVRMADIWVAAEGVPDVGVGRGTVSDVGVGAHAVAHVRGRAGSDRAKGSRRRRVRHRPRRGWGDVGCQQVLQLDRITERALAHQIPIVLEDGPRIRIRHRATLFASLQEHPYHQRLIAVQVDLVGFGELQEASARLVFFDVVFVLEGGRAQGLEHPLLFAGRAHQQPIAGVDRGGQRLAREPKRARSIEEAGGMPFEVFASRTCATRVGGKVAAVGERGRRIGCRHGWALP